MSFVVRRRGEVVGSTRALFIFILKWEKNLGVELQRLVCLPQNYLNFGLTLRHTFYLKAFEFLFYLLDLSTGTLLILLSTIELSKISIIHNFLVTIVVKVPNLDDLTIYEIVP